jgi:hypothetical protein
MSKYKLQIAEMIIITSLVLALSVNLVGAQYVNDIVTPVTFALDGKFTSSIEGLGVSYEIHGLPGASGTVTTSVYNSNPQATAFIPGGVKLSRFIVISFDIAESFFSQAIITISYSDADVLGLEQPYGIYKYMPSSNSFVELDADVDTVAKTMTITLTSTDDPLFAVGGASDEALEATSTTSWVIVIVSVVVIVFLVVFGVWYIRKTR